MKAIKILIFTAVLAAAAACDPTEMVTYEARNDEAFFEETGFYLLATNENSYTVTVSRGNSAGEVTVPVTVQVSGDENSAGAFTLPESITFQDGELYADYTISFDLADLTAGVENVVSIALADTDLPYETTCDVTIEKEFTWSAYATGTYTSALYQVMGAPVNSWQQTLQVAAEDPNVYRLNDVYAEGYHIVFNWDGSSSAIELRRTTPYNGTVVTLPTGATYGDYGIIDMYINTTTTNYSNGTFTFNYFAAVSAGQLTSWISDTFTLGSASSGGE